MTTTTTIALADILAEAQRAVDEAIPAEDTAAVCAALSIIEPSPLHGIHCRAVRRIGDAAIDAVRRVVGVRGTWELTSQGQLRIQIILSATRLERLVAKGEKNDTDMARAPRRP